MILQNPFLLAALAALTTTTTATPAGTGPSLTESIAAAAHAAVADTIKNKANITIAAANHAAGTGMGANIAVQAAHAIVNRVNECLDVPPSKEILAAAREMQAAEAAARQTMETAAKPQAEVKPIVVPTYVHIVASNETEEGGNLSDAQINAVIADTNAAYNTTRFQYQLAGTDRIVHPTWSRGDDDRGMKARLRRGDYRTLNLYYLPEMKEQANGFCFFPAAGAVPGSDPFVLDGCVIRADTHANAQTTPHEIGHWVGLFHTFEGAGDCDVENDMVDDTPALINKWSCDELDTCQSPGKDPVHNYMSYGSCRWEWTAGQRARMVNMYNKFRAVELKP